MSTKGDTGGEDRGANPLPAGRRRPRPRKPLGLHLRFPPRPEGLPKAPSPVSGGTGPLVPEETSVSSRGGGTRGTQPKWGNAPLRERAPRTRGVPPSLSTDARHRPLCQLDSERRQSRRKRGGMKCLLISTQRKSQTPQLDRAQYCVPQVSCHAYTGETEGLTAVSPGFQIEKWLFFGWDLAQRKEDVRTSLSVRQSLVEPCQNLTKSPRTTSVSHAYDGTTTTTPAVLETGSLSGQTKRGD